MILDFLDSSPKIEASCFVADNATIIGRVTLKENVNIWYGTVIRADENDVIIGRNTNIQDNCIIHIDRDRPTIIGDNVTVGHGAIIHACQIGNNVLVGMGALVLDGAKIGNNVIIGAGSIVTPGKEIADGSLIMGAPARLVRKLGEEELESLKETALYYVDLASKHK